MENNAITVINRATIMKKKEIKIMITSLTVLIIKSSIVAITTSMKTVNHVRVTIIKDSTEKIMSTITVITITAITIMEMTMIMATVIKVLA